VALGALGGLGCLWSAAATGAARSALAATIAQRAGAERGMAHLLLGGVRRARILAARRRATGRRVPRRAVEIARFAGMFW
jgi:hypothetical protein